MQVSGTGGMCLIYNRLECEHTETLKALIRSFSEANVLLFY